VRASKPFVTVDCRSLDAKNAYAHFFGHEKRDGNGFDYSLGKLYEAEGGTLFLREPQTLPDEVAEALLHTMRTGEPPKAGPRVNVRFIFSQRVMTEEGRYGQAFASIAPRIFVAPLRKRPEDVLPLSEHFLALYSASEQKYIRDISPRAQQWLAHHPWPGNINQLAHILRRAVILCESNMIELNDLQPSSSPKPIYMEHLALEGANVGVLKPLRSIEEEAIRYALQHCGGSMTRAARSLGIGRSTLYRKVSEMNISMEPISRVQTRLRGQ
jgi:DNA-binding NtrC family response regulator